MSRLYFDCPIQALYMMREFGVEFDYAKSNYGWDNFPPIDHDQLAIWIGESAELKIYVAKESEHVFIPQLGDWGQMKELPSRFVKLSTINEWKEPYGGGYRSGVDGSKIIMRNNKPFFTALVEE